VIDGRYSLEEQIGVGGMATVWRATDTLLGRQLAIKRLSPHLKSDRAASERFRREGQAAARLNHSGILTVFDAGEDQDGPWIAMELIEGETLAKRLAADGPMDLMAVASFMRQAAAAVDYAHENGIVHRDIKPANLMIEPGGRIRLADFGIAKPLDDPATITSPGEMVGTISYVAPEIIAGQPASASSDIYSLAAVAYEMLTGEKPYSADTTAGLLELIRQSKGPTLAGKVPAEVVAAFARAMARDPAMRHASARAFASALGQPSTLVLPAAEPYAGSTPGAPSLFEGSPDESTVLVPAAAKPVKAAKPTKPARPATVVVAPKPPAAEPITTGSVRTRRTMAAVGGLLLVVLVATFMSGALDAGDRREADEQAVQDESTTTNSPTTISTTAASTTVPEVTPASLAAEISEILATLEPPDNKPKDVREIEDRVNKAVDQWSEGEREMAAKSLEDAFTSLDKLPESDAQDELFVLLTTLTEEMGFTIESEDDD
jgi:eukaryotic-like serine/threonine-protein kinase